MRFGMSGCFLPADMREITPELCRRVRALGFSGIFTRFRADDPHDTPGPVIDETRRILEGEGVRLFQTTGYWQNLVNPSEAERAKAVETLRASLRLAGRLGSRGIDTGPGSMNPDGPWFPHPYNWTPQATAQLVKSLKESVSAAEDAQVFLSLEGHQLVTLSDERVTKEVLDAVGSRWVRSDFDSANWIRLPEVFDTAPVLDRMFDVLGPHIVSCHAKDVWPENRLAVHLQDGCPGKGHVCFRTLLKRMEALSPDYPVIVEGASTEELPAASELLWNTARELGIRVLDSGEAA